MNVSPAWADSSKKGCPQGSAKEICRAMEQAMEAIKESRISSDEVRRIQSVYAERERTLSAMERSDKVNPGYQRLVQECLYRLEHMLNKRFNRPLSECRVLDVGCGCGGLLDWFHKRGVLSQNLLGVDLLPSRIKIARETFPTFTFIEGNAENFDVPDHSFDLVTVFTVFSSILNNVMARNVARSMSRIITNSGAVVWYDMRYPNPWNPHLRAMTKPRIHELFPSFTLELESISLLPPMARRLGQLTDQAYPVLAAIPIFRSHYLGLLRPHG
jgi:ubiquinone/menaquinone biosynthesis C-methylase UbiE